MIEFGDRGLPSLGRVVFWGEVSRVLSSEVWIGGLARV